SSISAINWRSLSRSKGSPDPAFSAAIMFFALDSSNPDLIHHDMIKVSEDVSQDFGAMAGHQAVILDADSPPTFQVNPRFACQHHSRLQLSLICHAEPRRFVNVQPDPVTQPMAELPAETGLLNHPPGDGIHIAALGPGADRFDRRLLRFQHNSI